MTNNRKRIIEVATELMAKRGYHGTSLQMIADRVGISKSTIFHHFKNKEAILLAILEDAIPAATYNLLMLANEKGYTGREKLKEFIRVHMKLVAERGDILRIYLGESRYLDPQNAKLHKEGRKQYTQMVKQIIDQIQKEDGMLFRGMNSTIVANAILGICNWSIKWYRKNGSMTLDAVCEELYRIIDNRE